MNSGIFMGFLLNFEIIIRFLLNFGILMKLWEDSCGILGIFWDSLEGFFKFHLTCRSISTKNNSQTKNLNYEFSHLTVEIHRPVDDRLAAKISER